MVSTEDLTDKNNPALTPNLFSCPTEHVLWAKHPIWKQASALENIFKILRIDYYRRLTYLDEPNIKKGGVRIALRFSF